MDPNFEIVAEAVLACLKRHGYSARTQDEHRRCCEELRRHLAEINAPFSMEAAITWLAGRKAGWSFDTYKRYRRALYRLDMYMKRGSIEGEPHCHNNFFAYYDADVSYIKLPGSYKALFHEFHAKISAERGKGTVDHYIAGCTDFLLFIAQKGCTDPGGLTIDHVLAYAKRIRENQWTEETKKKYASGVSKLLAFFHVRGHVPRCYVSVLGGPGREKLLQSLVLPSGQGQAIQPSKHLEAMADVFFSTIANRRYSEPPGRLYGFVLHQFFLFLEVNCLEYMPETPHLWLEHIPKTPSWPMRRQIIHWFADFLRTGSAEKRGATVWRPLLLNALPDWSRRITEDFLALRRREGWAESTLTMCRSSCVRFFRFLDGKGVTGPVGITPALVMAFHDTDPHATAEGRNAYGARVRRLLKYMAEQKLVEKNLHLAISTGCAGRRNIVSVLTPEMVDAVYRFRESARGPLALRDAAMVLIGLRMGLRASDVINLKASNIDWEKRKISIIQTKTGKAVSLPMPTEVGNAIHRYIMEGRPASGADGVGCVFIRHRAPYSRLERNACRSALARVLATQGLELPFGQGFHITRRTFATRLLRARTPVDGIADALGHATRQAVSVYLAHDEASMRMCPLPFAMIGGQAA